MTKNVRKSVSKGGRKKGQKVRPWTEDEEQVLIRYVMAYPHNLSHCFLSVAEQIGRSSKAVTAHWYTCTSKRDDVMCFFTASKVHVSKNRKNGVGVPSNDTIWNKLCNVLKALFK